MKDSSNKPLIAAMIIIAVIIIILFLGSRSRFGDPYYSHRTNWFMMTNQQAPIINYQVPTTSTPQIIKTYGHPITVNSDYTYYSYPVTHTTTTYQYVYPSEYQSDIYPEGCTAYTAYSATTGWPCR